MSATRNNDGPERERALHDREGWQEYRRLVLKKLDELDEDIKTVREDVQGLKVKIAAWGFMAGLVGALITAVVIAAVQAIVRGGRV
jgi:hypothetical protein